MVCWDSNPGWHGWKCRRIQWAMVAPQDNKTFIYMRYGSTEGRLFSKCAQQNLFMLNVAKANCKQFGEYYWEICFKKEGLNKAKRVHILSFVRSLETRLTRQSLAVWLDLVRFRNFGNIWKFWLLFFWFI